MLKTSDRNAESSLKTEKTQNETSTTTDESNSTVKEKAVFSGKYDDYQIAEIHAADLLKKFNYEQLLNRKSWRLRLQFVEECLILCRKRKITAEE
uniref:Uncharacterized protein n=1 Tax=Panagrolaimus sp. PS1159 TaxID=55785 RepID=A0AC35F8J9_9BILA